MRHHSSCTEVLNQLLLAVQPGGAAAVPCGTQHRQSGTTGYVHWGPLYPQRHIPVDPHIRHPAQLRALG